MKHTRTSELTARNTQTTQRHTKTHV